MPCSSLRFLVVEDHPVQRRVAMSLLQSLGAAVVHGADNGRAALEVIHDPGRPIDIVLSDVSMPGMDGVELVRQLAAASSPIALILVSALEPAELARIANLSLAYRVNLLGAIGKPLSAVKLVPLIQRYRTLEATASHSALSLAEIARGWERDEFEPFFHPQARLSTTEVAGFHATPHWRHPERGTLPARAFMGSVDAYGLHDEMVWAMLGKSAFHCGRWRAQGLNLTVSVSLSLSSMAEPDLSGRVIDIVRQAGADPAWLVLGVSTAGVTVDRARALGHLARLRQAGFGLAVEDFGTGASWSELLKQVRFTHLKISRNLISGLKGDLTARAGLVVALDAARQWELVAVARGITSLDDWNLLQDWECDLGQGRLVGDAVAGADLPAWLRAQGRRAQARGVTGATLDLQMPAAPAQALAGPGAFSPSGGRRG